MRSTQPERISHTDLGLRPAHPEAPLAVLLPGLDSTPHAREPFLRALGAQVPFLQLLFPVDRIRTFAEAEAYLRERLPAGRPYAVFGYSYTGPVAIRLGADPPSDLVAVGLIVTFARLKLPVPSWLAHLAIRPLWFRIPAPKFLIAFLAGCKDPWVLEELQKAERAVPADVLADRLRSCFDIDVRDELKRVELPLLNVMAVRDSILPGLGEMEISELRPDARLIAIPGGHAALECTPEMTAAAISDFLLDLGKPSCGTCSF